MLAMLGNLTRALMSSLFKDSYILQILGNCAYVFWEKEWREVA